MGKGKTLNPKVQKEKDIAPSKNIITLKPKKCILWKILMMLKIKY